MGRSETVPWRAASNKRTRRNHLSGALLGRDLWRSWLDVRMIPFALTAVPRCAIGLATFRIRGVGGLNVAAGA
jgi:hypothetical protein